MNDGMRCDLRRLGHWELEGLGLWQGFGLGVLTSPFTVLSSLGAPSVMATSANGRESRLLGWGNSSRPPYFGRDIKAQKSTSVSLVVEAVYSTKFKKKKTTIPYACPATDGLSLEPVQNQGFRPMSSIMDYPLMHIGRFPRS